MQKILFRAILSVVVVTAGLALAAQTHAATLSVPAEYATIQGAINAATTGDEVVVAVGVYSGSENRNLDFGGKAITVRSVAGPEETIIDVEGEGRGVYFHSGEGNDAVFRGFTVRNGSVTYPYLGNHGAGITIREGSSPLIINVILENNTAGFATNGGGMYVSGEDSHPVLADSIVRHNSAASKGGGVGVWGGQLTIVNTRIEENTGGTGGGISVDFASAYVINSNISDNYGDTAGGIYLTRDGSMEAVNTTIALNDTWQEGGGAYIAGRSDLNLENSIVWGNTARVGDDSIHLSTEDATFSAEYSDIENGWVGEGNMDIDPLFVIGPLGNYYLSHVVAGNPENSPVIDVGLGLADNNCYDLTTGFFCMSTLATAANEISDAQVLDLGYHYPIEVLELGGKGDIDNNGRITSADAILAFNIALAMYQPSEGEFWRADVDSNERVNTTDARCIFQEAMGQPNDCFPN